MAQTITPRDIPVKRWSLNEFYRLYEAGFVTKQSELIEGEIIEPMATSSFHAYLVDFLERWLRTLFGDLYVREEKPVRIVEADGRESEPQPDLAVYNVPSTTFKFRHARPEEAIMVIEVSYPTREYDLARKAPLYARAGIAEYWVIDVQSRLVIVHREPQGETYAHVTPYGETEEVSPSLKPEARLSVSELLPPVGTEIE